MLSLLVAGMFYMDLGLSYQGAGQNNLYIYPSDTIKREWGPELFTAEVGYKVKRVSIFGSHKSSVSQQDTGVNEVGIKGRILEGAFYIDAALSYHDVKRSNIYYYPTENDRQEWGPGLFTLEAGYRYKRMIFYGSYKTSVSQLKAGMPELGIKARVFEW